MNRQRSPEVPHTLHSHFPRTDCCVAEQSMSRNTMMGRWIQPSTSTSLVVIRLLLIAVLITTTPLFTFVNAQQSLEIDCDPCIDRPTYKIRAIVHGTKDDAFWQRVRAASVQSGLDMRIDLEFDLYDTFDPKQMAADVIEAATSPTPPAALVVTIPSPDVEGAIVEALNYIPVFGMNSGYSVAESLGVMGFVAMDEYVGGQDAAKEFLALSKTNITRALFINHQHGNTAMESRRKGFQDALQDESADIQVDELVIEPSSTDSSDVQASIESALEGCPYDAVLLGGATSLEQTTSAFYANGCSLSDHLLGTFDTGPSVYAAIATGKISFAISQQSHLQGSLSIVFAAIYATTGKKLARSGESEYGVWLSGPQIINLRNLPSDTLQTCESSAFPVCPNNMEPDGLTESSCKCTDRSKIVIAGVLHGVTTDSFWDIVFAQAHQAADDLGIDLRLDRLEPQPSDEVWHSKMANKMISLCREGVDGLFITIPSDAVVAAVKECQSLNVPVMSVNSGAQLAVELGLIHHISQVEYSAGFGAGKRMVESGMKEGMCLNIALGNTALEERCQGFEDALNEEGIPYLGMVVVPRDNEAAFIKKVEDTAGRDDDYDGLGFLTVSGAVFSNTLPLKERHPSVLLANFDVSNEIYDALDDGILLFGIDQNPFVQGYMPIWLLTLMAHTKQHLRNTFIETGPRFVEESPSDALQACVANNFEVCPRAVDHNMNQITRIRPVGLALAALVLVASVFFAAWVAWYRKKTVIRKSQPLFLGMICVGTMLMASAIIPLSIDDSIATFEACSKACMAAPWLVTIGFTTAFTAVFSKIWRINRLLKKAQSFKRVVISTKDVMLPFAILLTINIIFMVVWTVVDPMYWERRPSFGVEDGLSSYGLCVLGRTGVSTAMLSCLLLLAFCVVILANYEAYCARKLSVEFSESKYIAMSMVCFLQVMLLGVPLIALVSTNPTAEYFVKSAIIFVLSMSMLLLIFVPKMIFLKNDEKKTKEAKRSSTSQWSSSTYGRGSNTLHVISNNSRQNNNNEPQGLSSAQMKSLEKVFKDNGVQLNESTNLEALFKQAGIPIGSGSIRRVSGRSSFASCSIPEDSTYDENKPASDLDLRKDSAPREVNFKQEAKSEEAL